MENFLRTSNMNSLIFEKNRLLNEKIELAQQLANANSKLRGADEYVVKLTARSRELMLNMALQNKKFLTVINRMQKAFPGQEAEVLKVVEGTERDYEPAADPEWHQDLKDFVNSQPLFEEEQTQKREGNSKQRTQSL